MRRDNDPPRYFRVGDVLERSEDGRRGAVFAHGLLRARVAWEDGVLSDIEQHDMAYTIVARAFVSSDGEEEEVKALRAEAARRLCEAGELAKTSRRLEDEAVELDMQADEIEHEARKHQLAVVLPSGEDAS